MLFNLYLFLLLIFFFIVLCSWIYLTTISLKSYIAVPTIRTIISNKRNGNGHSYYLTKGLLNKSITVTTDLSSNDFPFLSVIVPARNEEANIENCIRSLLAQNYPHFEVIAIDDSSTDNTLSILINMTDKLQSKLSSSPSLTTKNTNLKIISIEDKPQDWKGKTWAMQQGYLKSKGDILLFTDADTKYISKDALLLTVSYMQKEKLDALTGILFSELRDFLSKIVMPLWATFSVIFGRNASKMNNPKSKVAYLLGAFIMIKRKVLEDIGTFDSVRNAIQEDKVLGEHLKYRGFKVKIIKTHDLISGFWSRDPFTLWYGIERTLAPVIKANKLEVFWNLVIVFFMALLPFLTLPYTIWLITINKKVFLFDDTDLLYAILFYLNILVCIIVIGAIATKDIRKYKISPIYSVFAVLASFFIVVAHLNALLQFGLNDQKPIPWRGRKTQA
jgi:glycosyltransferase involved in cell wall biosynthesis